MITGNYESLLALIDLRNVASIWSNPVNEAIAAYDKAIYQTYLCIEFLKSASEVEED